MTPAAANVERLIAMSDRLSDALEADIESLKRGMPRQMRMLEPEMQKLSALFSREALGMNPTAAKALPPEPRKQLGLSTKRFRDALAMHARLLTRMRNASEGMIRAVAEEVERKRTSMRVYSPVQKNPTAPSAMIFNSVI
ncbi:MAG TPA: hypothetical protein VH000_03240 [Rhizomicrobium sp.]|jgi:hypothetical protein|nr:hypothetical protein [Rhizomicrobium sp.]HEX4533221.1 hypothetical protein [Rhizomicrobium sp.]